MQTMQTHCTKYQNQTTGTDSLHKNNDKATISESVAINSPSTDATETSADTLILQNNAVATFTPSRKNSWSAIFTPMI